MTARVFDATRTLRFAPIAAASGQNSSLVFRLSPRLAGGDRPLACAQIASLDVERDDDGQRIGDAGELLLAPLVALVALRDAGRIAASVGGALISGASPPVYLCFPGARRRISGNGPVNGIVMDSQGFGEVFALLGQYLEPIEALIKDDPVVLPMWRQAITGAKHVHADSDIVTIKPERGNARGYTLARLKRERSRPASARIRRRQRPRFSAVSAAAFSS